jgi:predicted nucleotide-binding protein
MAATKATSGSSQQSGLQIGFVQTGSKLRSTIGRKISNAAESLFLGYCGSSVNTAKKTKKYLTSQLDVTAVDWRTDFEAATFILKQIEEASRRCRAGVFLFTKDDPISDTNAIDRAVPRDNVVFEAGYFSALKGKSQVLIVREVGAKMPADLGGDIYASLENKEKIEAIKPSLEKFVSTL